ncbi:D-xylose transport system substrate-binding protein [Paenarthrobacter nicotinovorans]|uniref:substrate-binding domain-containing protein n=1 Tax=Paenarthrobacter nicotinovorans TaxID=29320 RepID=UPI00278389E9|nr:substrate-binding domain-containing protein [Paenarthrobacter nicotinovorans]MDP9933811.1 D-xylose transport system substrate-binding protein [Paenarthrobacter nicotinovorans]
MGIKSKIIPALAAIAAALSMTACGQGVNPPGASSENNPTIGVLFPDNKTPLWEGRLWPGVRDGLKKDCPDCKVVFANVASDATEQQNQAESMLAQGVKALLLAPVSSNASQAIVAKAKAQNVPVIGFGIIPEGEVQGFVGVDVVELGRLQGRALLEQISAGGDPKRGCVIALDGDAQTPGTFQYSDGRKETLDPNVNLCKETNVANWTPANAQAAMDQAITSVGKDKIIGVYGMNDGITGGASAAMRNAGFTTPFPPLGGGDADLAAIQRIVVGAQTFTIDARQREWGSAAAPALLSVARGEKLTSNQTEKNETVSFPWIVTPSPLTITKENIQKDVIDKGSYSFEEICTTDYKAACESAGLKPKA